MTKNISKIVTTDQEGIHRDLDKIVSKHKFTYQRPIADFSVETFKKIMSVVKYQEVVFDFGCGIGESSYKLAKIYPNKFIVGIDKSVSRLNRKNDFKEEKLGNMALFRGELLDLIFLIYNAYKADKINIHSLYFLYPNPWPKKIHVKRRFHGNPIAPFIFGMDVPIILRSNWKLYLKEFAFVSNLYKRKSEEIQAIEVHLPLTPFERKYIESSQRIYELRVFK